MESLAAREHRALGNLEKVMRFRTATEGIGISA
jgi:hypothetical protein